MGEGNSSEKRIAAIIQLSRSRMDETPVTEWDIPHYALWDDGSEYEVFFVEGYFAGGANHATRRFHGPVFGRGVGDWTTEGFTA